MTASGDQPVVNHVGLCVRDLDRARQFYEQVLGFEFERELTVPDEPAQALLGVEPPVNLTAVYLTRGSFVLELMHFDRPGNPEPPDRVFNEPGLTHLSLSVDDLDAAVSLALASGGELVTTMSRAVLVRDPDGQMIELLPMAYRQALDRREPTEPR